MVAESVTGAAVSVSDPFGVLGYWVQVLIPNDMVPRMMEAFRNAKLDGNNEPKERLEFDWPDKNFKLIIDQPPVCPLPTAMSFEAAIEAAAESAN